MKGYHDGETILDFLNERQSDFGYPLYAYVLTARVRHFDRDGPRLRRAKEPVVNLIDPTFLRWGVS